MASAPKNQEKPMPIPPSGANACVLADPPLEQNWPAPPPPYTATAPIGFHPSGQGAPPSYAYATESTTFVQQPAQHTVVREVLVVESPRHHRRSALGLLSKIVHQGGNHRHAACECQHQEDCVHHEGNHGHHKHRGHRGHKGHRH